MNVSLPLPFANSFEAKKECQVRSDLRDLTNDYLAFGYPTFGRRIDHPLRDLRNFLLKVAHSAARISALRLWGRMLQNLLWFIVNDGSG